MEGIRFHASEDAREAFGDAAAVLLSSARTPAGSPWKATGGWPRPSLLLVSPRGKEDRPSPARRRQAVASGVDTGASLAIETALRRGKPTAAGGDAPVGPALYRLTVNVRA